MQVKVTFWISISSAARSFVVSIVLVSISEMPAACPLTLSALACSFSSAPWAFSAALADFSSFSFSVLRSFLRSLIWVSSTPILPQLKNLPKLKKALPKLKASSVAWVG